MVNTYFYSACSIWLQREVVFGVVAVLLCGSVMKAMDAEQNHLHRALETLTANTPFNVTYNKKLLARVESIKIGDEVCDIRLFYTAAKLLCMFTDKTQSEHIRSLATFLVRQPLCCIALYHLI